MKILHRAFLVAAILCVGGFALWASNPIHRNEAGIRTWLLQKAPLGSSVHDLATVFTHEGWKVKYHWV